MTRGHNYFTSFTYFPVSRVLDLAGRGLEFSLRCYLTSVFCLRLASLPHFYYRQWVVYRLWCTSE